MRYTRIMTSVIPATIRTRPHINIGTKVLSALEALRGGLFIARLQRRYTNISWETKIHCKCLLVWRLTADNICDAD